MRKRVVTLGTFKSIIDDLVGTLCVSLRGNFFQCHVFAMKSVQNLKSFWRSSQNYFVLALFSSLYS
jgi:hypothetical protein